MARDGVSIILPVYNGATFLGETLASVLRQDHPHWELWVVDDGSTDGTLALAQGFAAQDPRIQVLSQPNGGTASARNRGVAQARYDWVAFLDADDLWRPWKLSSDWACARAHHYEQAVYYAWTEEIDLQGRVQRRGSEKQHRGHVTQALLQYLFVCPSGIFLHREMVDAVGGFAEDQGCEDVLFFLRLAQRYPYYPTETVSVRYRYRPTSKSRDFARDLDVDRHPYVEALRAFVAEYPEYRLTLPEWTSRAYARIAQENLKAGCLEAAKAYSQRIQPHAVTSWRHRALIQLSCRLNVNLYPLASCLKQAPYRLFGKASPPANDGRLAGFPPPAPGGELV